VSAALKKKTMTVMEEVVLLMVADTDIDAVVMLFWITTAKQELPSGIPKLTQ